MKYRIHLRHTGGTKPSFRINPILGGWTAGFNIDFGYWFIAVRKKRKGEVKREFIDLKFGKAQQRNIRMRRSEAFKWGRQEGAMLVFEAWISEEGHYWLIQDLLDRHDLEYKYDRVRPKRHVNTDD